MLRSKNTSSSSSTTTTSSTYKREVEPLLSSTTTTHNNSKSNKSWDPLRDAYHRLTTTHNTISLTNPATLKSLSTLVALGVVFGVVCTLGNSGMNYKMKEDKMMPTLNIRGGVVEGGRGSGAGGMSGLYAAAAQEEEKESVPTISLQQNGEEGQYNSDTMIQQQIQEEEEEEYEKPGMLMSQQAAAMDAGLMPNHLLSKSTIVETEAAAEFDEVYHVNVNQDGGAGGEGGDEIGIIGVEEEEKVIVPFEGTLDPQPAEEEGGEGATGNPDLSLSTLSNYKDSWDPYESSDNPVFWHIPKAGGSTVKDIIGTCHRFVMATEFGVTDGHDQDTEIAIVYPDNGTPNQDRSPFVNVDTTTIPGINRAKTMGFADSGLADAIVTPFIYEANDLFTPTAKGRLFTVFRHPIDRAVSLFYYIQVADWEPTYSPELKDWTLEDYAKSSIIENNWMTRQLSNTFEGDLNDDHLRIAMEVIRRKFLVGLMKDIARTMERFERFFRWTYHVNPPNQEACRERLLSGGSNKNASGNKKEKPKEGSEEYELLKWQNLYDLQLYEYIETLFEEQEQFVQDVPADFRNLDATCCKCDPPSFPPEGFTCPLAIKG